MNRDRLRARIARHEGYRDTPYLCTEGYWTVGYGHKVHDFELRALTPHRTLGSLLSWLCSRETHERWLAEDIARSESDAIRFLGDAFDRLTDGRQEALVEMAFQLGGAGLNGFVKMRDAILRGHWVEAHAHGLDSLWARQTPSRAEEVMDLLLEG